jgi:hypothetical protein
MSNFPRRALFPRLVSSYSTRGGISGNKSLVGEGRGGWSRGRYDVLESVRCRCHKRLLKMTKTELGLALAEATRDQ